MAKNTLQNEISAHKKIIRKMSKQNPSGASCVIFTR